jgi:hypothetical protein
MGVVEIATHFLQVVVFISPLRSFGKYYYLTLFGDEAHPQSHVAEIAIVS